MRQRLVIRAIEAVVTDGSLVGAAAAVVTHQRAASAQLTGAPGTRPNSGPRRPYGWTLEFTDGHQLRLLMPGIDLTRLRDDITAGAPCLDLIGATSTA